MDADTVVRLRRVVLELARQLNAVATGEGLTPAEAFVLGDNTKRYRPLV